MSLALGAGRETKESIIDMAAGIVLNKKVDDKVEIGETLAYVHGNDLNKAEEVKNRLLNIFVIGEKNQEAKKLIYDEIN